MKKLLALLCTFVMALTLVACSGSSAGGKEAPDYYGTYEITSLALNGEEVDQATRDTFLETLNQQNAAFTLTFGDKNVMNFQGSDYKIDLDWEGKTFKDPNDDQLYSFRMVDGQLWLDLGDNMEAIFTKTK